MKVKAAVARALRSPLSVESLDLAEPGPGDILVRLVASGVGRVDREAVNGILDMHLPFVPGSEGTGFVERVGEHVTSIEPGDAVLINYAFCGVCEACRTGHRRACVAFELHNLSGRREGEPPPFASSMGEVGGCFFGQSSFATHVVCRADQAVKLPKEMPLEIAAAFGGECLTAVAAISQVFRVQPGDVLAITGAGLVGLVACMIAKHHGAAAIVVADPDERLRALASDCGATVAVHGDADLAMAVGSLAADGAAFALETTGRASGRAACLASLCPGGLMGLVAPAWGRAEDSEEDGKSIIVVDRSVASNDLIARLVAEYVAGRFEIEPLITFFPLEHVNEALAASAGAAVKAIIRFSVGAFDDLDRATSGGGVKEVPEPSPEAEPAELETQPAIPVIP